MKTIVIMSFLLSCVVFGYTNTNATLIENSTPSGHVVYDDVANQYWIWNLKSLSGLSYAGQINKIYNEFNASSYYGISLWHMASLSEISGLWLNSAVDLNKFESNYSHGGSDYRYGRYESSPEIGTHYTASARYEFAWFPWESKKSLLNTLDPFGSVEGSIADYSSENYLNDVVSAWVTAPGPVPEPSSLLLLGVGLFAFIVYGIRRRNMGSSWKTGSRC